MAIAATCLSDPVDAVEIFSDSLESLFDHHVPAHGDPLQLYTYTPPPTSTAGGASSLTVRVPPQQVNELFSHHVWNSGLRMADAIAEGRLVTRGETVVELGAGAGIPSLMAARAGAKRVRLPRVAVVLIDRLGPDRYYSHLDLQVVLTDYDDPLIVANLRSNIALALGDTLQASVAAEGHSWGDETSLTQVLA